MNEPLANKLNVLLPASLKLKLLNLSQFLFHKLFRRNPKVNQLKINHKRLLKTKCK